MDLNPHGMEELFIWILHNIHYYANHKSMG